MLQRTLKIMTLLMLGLSAMTQAYELKTYYQDGYPKYYLTEREGKQKAGGLCVEIIQLIEQHTPDIKIVAQPQLVAFKRIKASLAQGKIDVFLGMTRTPEREKQFIYVDPPLYQIKHVVAVRRDDPVVVRTFNDIRKLGKEGIILTNQGTSTGHFLKKQGGLELDAGARNLSRNLRKLLQGKGRFVYFHNLGLVSTIKDEGLTGQVKILPATFYTYSHYLAFSKKAPQPAIERVKETLVRITNNRELAKITEKYFNF